MSTKAYKMFNGRRYTLYKSGTKSTVMEYVKKYGIPRKASYRIVKSQGEYRLYMLFSK